MTRLAILRHAPTQWNADKRLQGRSDQPLSAEGVALARTWTLPAEAVEWEILCSPLQRARRTAEILSGREAAVDNRLVELSFGAWEGRRLADLRRELGAAMRANEAAGLDFLPPGGESPRMLAARLRPFLAECALRGQPRIAVAHKAVIRALYALATGWDMKQDPPEKLRGGCCHLFEVGALGRAKVVTLNIPLGRAERDGS